MFLLDTNVLSELRRRDRCHRSVARWAEAVHPAELFLSAITILEIEAGILLLARRDPQAGAVLRSWIDTKVLRAFEGRILAVDTAVAQRCAQLHVPNSRAERDALITATALVHGLTLATRNVRDFELIGIQMVNPWEFHG